MGSKEAPPALREDGYPKSRHSGGEYACDLDRSDDVRAPAHMRAFSAIPGDVALHSK